MAKALNTKINAKNVRELLEQMIPDKKLLKKYELLLEKKLHDLKAAEKLEEIVKPLRTKLEKSCMKPLEAKSLQDFSQRVMSVLRVQAKKQKKNIEKRIGRKINVKMAPKKRRSTKPRAAAKKATA